MKKTMRKSALLSSVAMLIVSAIVLTSATYAWFSSSKVVTVEQLKAGVKVTTGLLISVDKGKNWNTTVNFDDAVAVKDGWTAGIKDDMIFDPVSTADGSAWVEALYNEDDDTLTVSPATPGEKFIAVPLWVTGPVKEEVKATVNFGSTNETIKKCLKFALVPASGDNGDVIGDYTEAVAATPNEGNKFRGISAEGTTETSGAYVVTTGGKEINELATSGDNGIKFTIPDGTTTENPMKYVAYLWLEGNDADCIMTEFTKVSGSDLTFEMTLSYE